MATVLNFSDLKSHLGLEDSSFDDYPDLKLIADSVHSALVNYCGRELDTVSTIRYTKRLITADRIDLLSLPIVTIGSLTIDGLAINYTIDDYGLVFDNTITGLCEVTFRGGFTPDIPEEVYRAELFQTIYEYQNKNNLAVTNFSNDGGTTSSPGFVLLKQVKELLAKYVHPCKLGF